MRSALVACSLACALSACGEGPPLHRERLFALGTTVEVIAYRPGEDRMHHAVVALRSSLERSEQRWHPDRDGAELAAVNATVAAGGSPVPLPPALAADLRLALGLSQASGGRFDPGLGALVDLWGFRTGERAPGPPPSQAAIEDARPERPAAERITLNADGLSADPSTRLDLGGMAKGLAVADGVEALRAAGVSAGILNLGGDLMAWGRPGDRPWRIAVRHPRGDGPLVSLELEGAEAVFTSGDYERWFEHQGIRYHHILDPTTGMPARGLTSVTVVHRDPTLADAAATALFVAGPEGWLETARALGVDRVMVVTESGSVVTTPAMAGRLRIEVDPPVELEVAR